MLNEFAMMLWGAVLAMAYFSEFRVRFDGSITNDAVQASRDSEALMPAAQRERSAS